MSRFDLYRGQGYSDFILDVQANHLDFLDSRMVIPVVREDKMSLVNPRLHVRLAVNGDIYYAVTNMMGAVSPFNLGHAMTNVADHSYAITAAIDFLLQGF